MELVKNNILHLIDRLVAHYQAQLAKRGEHDYDAEAVASINFLKTNASGVVAKVIE